MIRSAVLATLLATSLATHASEEAHAKADPAKGKVIAETVCAACHGADGNSPASANPNLAGQVPEYIAKQLRNFKSIDGKPALRNNAIMAGMAAGGLPVLGPDRISYRLYAWPIITAVIVGVFDTDHMHLAFSTLSLTAFVIYTRSADVYARMLAETFTLEFEKGEMLAAVEQARQTAERSDRAKTEFLANISHELRTPLNGIIGIGELLSDEALSSEQKNLVALLQDNANQLSQRIDHLIELAALEAGHVQCRPSPFTVVELLEGLVSPQSEAALAKGLHIELHHASPLPDVVVGDLERLRQIFKHLVDNAIKFTDRGTISITMRQVERSAQQVSIEFSIRDTGPGISAQVQEMISGILTQGDGSLIRRHSGVGVGLPIARRLTELLGGQLEIESGMGRGSCFRFVLPFALPAEDQPLA